MLGVGRGDGGRRRHLIGIGGTIPLRSMFLFCYLSTVNSIVRNDSHLFSSSPLLPNSNDVTIERPALTGSGDGYSCRYLNYTVCVCSDQPFTNIPQTLHRNLKYLEIVGGALELLDAGSLDTYRHTLEELKILRVSHFSRLESGCFREPLLRLNSIYISGAPALRFIAPDVFQVSLPLLRVIKLLNTGLVNLPEFRLQTAEIMHGIDLTGNRIERLSSHSFRIQSGYLLLDNNEIVEIDESAFSGSKLGKLSVRGNAKLSRLHQNAFDGLEALKELDLSDSSITDLPTSGLNRLHLINLSLERVESLHGFPSVYNFGHLKSVHLTYPYHCCAFRFPHLHNPLAFKEQSERLKCSSDDGYGEATTTSLLEGDRESWSGRELLFFGNGFGDFVPHPSSNISTSSPSSVFSSSNAGHEQNMGFHNVTVIANSVKVAGCGSLVLYFPHIDCQPQPDAFNPCEDVMGSVGLRVGVWIVVLAAISGNFAVMVVLMSTRFKMTVSKFLMCNLAFADFCMGLYLFMVAVMDAHTNGQYFNYAILWQTGSGCRIAGFLTVFASELSIFTLTVITIERWYAITYAIHLNKRLRLGTAVKVMVVGWLFAITFAALPLLGVSGYHKTSICLPFDIARPIDLAYVLSLFIINGQAFVLICACYAKMYWTISAHHSTVKHNDKTVAKRMALLVFTDFACWAPIAFFGVTALMGHPLIDVTSSKILLVFFYPLNSCANPFLYAIFTKQYRRDLMILLNRYGFLKERSSTNKSIMQNKQVGSFSVTNLTNNVCLRNRTCLEGGTSGSGGSGGGVIGTRRASLVTQVSTVIDNHCYKAVDKNYDDVMDSVEDGEEEDEGQSRGDKSYNSAYELVTMGESKSSPSAFQDVSPKHKGSPHPIKNYCARLLLSDGSRNRSASLGGAVQDLVPLRQQAEATCKSAI